MTPKLTFLWEGIKIRVIFLSHFPWSKEITNLLRKRKGPPPGLPSPKWQVCTRRQRVKVLQFDALPAKTDTKSFLGVIFESLVLDPEIEYF